MFCQKRSNPLYVPEVLKIVNRDPPGNVSGVAGDEEFLQSEPVGHIIVLPSPPPEQVGEPIHGFELVHRHGRDPTEDVVIGKSVEEAVDADGHVTGLNGTCIEIPVILRQKVHVVEDVAHVVVLLHGLGGTDVHEHGPVEGLVACLLHDVNPVLDLLSLDKK